jgi:hypothetical protein
VTEQNAVALQAEDQISPVTVVAETDWFLQNLVDLTNRGAFEIGVTFQVSGMLVSGMLISGEKYFEEFAALFAGGFKNNTDVSDAFHKLISSYKKIYDVIDSELPPPNYVHLQNAKFFHPGQKAIPTNQGVLWRGRIAEIGGFYLGSLSED